MTLRVCMMHENDEQPLRARLTAYTDGDTDQTMALRERSEPVEEYVGRDREVASLVAPTVGSTLRRLSVTAVPGRCR